MLEVFQHPVRSLLGGRGSAKGVRLSQPERRKLARLALHVFARLRSGIAATAFAETRNVSAGGLYLYTWASVKPGEELDCILILPEQFTHMPAPMVVGCRGKVVRVQHPLPGQKLGVAMQVSRYDFAWPGEDRWNGGSA